MFSENHLGSKSFYTFALGIQKEANNCSLFNFKTEIMDKEKELLSKEELALMRGGITISQIDTCNSCKLHSL